jgi:hypothetical protein
VTPTTQNCDQTQRKELNFKSDISVNVEVFNRRIIMQFPKVALDYDFDLIRYCPTREFYSDLHCLETFLIVFKITCMFYVGPNFTDCFVPMLGHITVRVITCFGVIQ